MENSVLPLTGGHIQKVGPLKPENLNETVEFNVALQMQDLPKLLARLQTGEQISRDDLAANYLPTAEEYAAVTAWLTAQGLTITQRDDGNRLGVFVQGNVAQVQESLAVQFAKVTTDEGTFTSAASAPSIPTELAGVILGLNGLQPHRHVRKHSTFQPLTNNAPPYLVREILGAYGAANTGYTGAGETIAILIDTFPANSDLTAFWTNNNIPQTLSNIEKVAVVGGTLDAPSGEETLDTEWTSGIASGAKIRIYASTTLSDVNLDKSIQRIIDDLPTQPTLHQLTISLGAGETSNSTSELQTDSQYFATLAAAGVSVFVSSGDSGSNEGGTLQPSYYASDPSVTGVGGTALRLTSAGVESSETAWSGSGGGISHYFARPSWQVGAGVPAGTKRLVPDVSSVASPNTGAYVYLGGSVQQIGGTSWSSPTWAGYCAMINQARIQKGLKSIGLLNPHIYPLIGTSNFRDITSGSNGAYSAGTGYDLVTGIGSPIVGTLLQTLAGVTSNAPSITSFTPTSGAAGAQVTITGLDLTGATAVKFNGAVATTFKVVSATEITATVPTSASTGAITVVAPSGTTSSATDFTVTGAAPANDNFANAAAITGATGTINGSNVGATKQTGEPNHAGNAGGASIWYVWTAPETGSVTFDTFGSNFDTLLAVYTGSAVNALTAVASNDDFGTGTTSSVTFAAKSGTVYRIAIDGHNGATGSTTLNWNETTTSATAPTIASFTPASGAKGAAVTITGKNFTGATAVRFNGVTATFTIASSAQIHTTVPASATTGPISVTTPNGTAASASNFTVPNSTTGNDNFANAYPIPSAGGTVTGSNVNETKQPGEPDHAGNAGGKSVWWTWKPTVSGACMMKTAGSSFDTLLAVYTGNAVNALSVVAANDDAGAFTVTSRVHFNAIAGTTYHIAVDGYDGDSGSIVLTVTEK